MKALLAAVLSFIASLSFAQTPPSDQGLIVLKALGEVGVYKMPGMSDSRVRQYTEETGNPIEFYTQDGWCSSFAAWVLKSEGYEYSAYPTMEEWLYCGVPTDHPVPGDIVLIPGHIAFFDGYLDIPGFAPHTLISILGGNQAHRVCVMPLGETWVQMYLHPVKAPEGWLPRKHFGFDLSSTQSKLDDKTNIMSVLEYEFHPERDTRIPSTPGF